MELRHRIRSRYIFGIVYFVFLFGFIAMNVIFADTSNTLASAEALNADSVLLIPDIDLKADVVQLSLVDGELKTPDYIAGSFQRSENKTLIIGHATTVFSKLNQASLNNIVVYNNGVYRIVSKYVAPKSDINMSKLLKRADRDTLVLMTCAGESLGDKDATHRLIITAIRE
ncbi:sortase [Candidatus Saccharibacteria bacterium]|nr:sortase [Candidatus Saccharibacteria bacterium]